MVIASQFHEVGIAEINLSALVNQEELDRLSELPQFQEMEVELVDANQYEITIAVDELEDGDKPMSESLLKGKHGISGDVSDSYEETPQEEADRECGIEDA